MLRLDDIMERDVLAVSPELTLRELVETLTEHSVSGAPVVANGVLIGVISATDILEFEEGTPGVPVERQPVVEDTEWAIAEGWEEGAAAPSVFFSGMWEPTEVDALERIRTTESPEWDVLDEYSVAEAMTRSVISLPPDASVKKAAHYAQVQRP